MCMLKPKSQAIRCSGLISYVARLHSEETVKWWSFLPCPSWHLSVACVEDWVSLPWLSWGGKACRHLRSNAGSGDLVSWDLGASLVCWPRGVQVKRLLARYEGPGERLPGNSLLFLMTCLMKMMRFVQDLRQGILITCASMPSPIIGRWPLTLPTSQRYSD